MSKKETLIISAFPGTGKTFYHENHKDTTLDSDSSMFDKVDFPANYIEHIKNKIGTVDIIFVSSHKEVREALVKEGIEFTVVHPDIDLKEEYIERYKNRGNNDRFVELLKSNWDAWIKGFEEDTCNDRVILGSEMYITNFINAEKTEKNGEIN